MHRPDLFMSGSQSFADGVIEIAAQTKRIADHFEGDIQQKSTKKPRTVATRKVVYCTTDWLGKIRGPKYGRFFSEFPNSPEGMEAAESKDPVQTVSLQLTWLLNQPSAVLLSASHTGQATVWTVAVDEAIADE